VAQVFRLLTQLPVALSIQFAALSIAGFYSAVWCFVGLTELQLFDRVLCLPSGPSLTECDSDRVIEIVRSCCRNGV
jgi:hypothetical protein